MIAPGSAFSCTFTTRRVETAVSTNADALPGAFLLRNGAYQGAVAVSVAQAVDGSALAITGTYTASCTIPSGWAEGDVVEIVATATVNGVTDRATVGSATLTLSGQASLTNQGYTTTRAGYLDILSGLVAAIWAAVVDSSGVTTLLARLTGARATNLDNIDAAVSSRSTFNAASDHVLLDMTQAVPQSTPDATVGAAFNAANVQGAGDWVLTGTTLVLKNLDGTTFRTFTLDSATSPTSRIA